MLTLTDKIDWAPTGGPGIHYPSIGVNKLIEEMGITTKLVYDDGQHAINFDNLSKDLRNSIPDRPVYVIEEKKCHDIIEALLNINREKCFLSIVHLFCIRVSSSDTFLIHIFPHPASIRGQDMIYFWKEQMQIVHVM